MRKLDKQRRRGDDQQGEFATESMAPPLEISSSSGSPGSDSSSRRPGNSLLSMETSTDAGYGLRSSPLLAQRQRRLSPADKSSSSASSPAAVTPTSSRESSPRHASFATPQRAASLLFPESSTTHISPRRSPVKHIISQRTRRMTVALSVLLMSSCMVTFWSTLVLMRQDDNNTTTSDHFSFHRPLRQTLLEEQQAAHYPMDRKINAIPHVVVVSSAKVKNDDEAPNPPSRMVRAGHTDQGPETAVIQPKHPSESSADNVLHGRTPRVVYWNNRGGDDDIAPLVKKYHSHRVLEDDPMLHAPPGFEAAPQDRMRSPAKEGNCVPMHEWQTRSFPNCNVIHEIDLHAAGPHVGKTTQHDVSFEDRLYILGQGWFRHTWRLDHASSSNNNKDAVVLKTLRLDREFYDEFFDLHRRDAVAMERLTHSSFIMNIYGYCGQSAINELADFEIGGIDSLEKFNRNTRGNKSPQANRLRLQVASSIAVGLAHVHEIDAPRGPSLVHYDLNPRNIAIVKGGRPKLNDFNIAEFLRWDPTTNRTCGFPSRLHEPWWRAPEEMSTDKSAVRLVDEKVDVYALGSILFHVLTTHSPRGKMKPERMEGVRHQVERGERPQLPQEYVKSKDPAVRAIREALALCHEPDPKKRASSRQVAEVLLAALMELKSSRSNHKDKERH